jgi:hypothetical protein
MDSQIKEAGEVERNRSQSGSTVLAANAREAAERLGLDPASEIVGGLSTPPARSTRRWLARG